MLKVATIAQLVEQRICNAPVIGSSPVSGSRNMAQLVAHLLWEQGAAGSSPAIPTPAEDCVGSLAQLVQSTLFTPRGSLVRVQ